MLTLVKGTEAHSSLGAGWMSDTDRFNTAKDRLDLRADAGRFEIGHQHNDGIYGLGLVAMQNNRLGLSNIESYVCGLADYFCSRVEETEGFGSVTISPGKTAARSWL